MARTMDAIVQQQLGALQLQIAALQVQVEDLTEQLAEAKRAADKAPLHRVPDPPRAHGEVG